VVLVLVLVGALVWVLAVAIAATPHPRDPRVRAVLGAARLRSGLSGKRADPAHPSPVAASRETR
jgi:hypothetical protein